MGHAESQAWTVFLDGRSHQIVLEQERLSMWSNHKAHRVLVNGSVVVTGPTTVWGIMFKIGRNTCKIRIKGWTFTPQQLLINDRDASDFEPPAYYFAPEPRGGAPASAAREQQLEHALEALQDRLLRGEISENVYTELKEALVRRYENGGDLTPARSEKVIERQVVVMHCKFCSELTPVDLSACKSCGAGLR